VESRSSAGRQQGIAGRVAYVGPVAGTSPRLASLKRANVLFLALDPPPLKWSDLRYVFDIQEDCNGKEAIQA